MEGPMTQAPQQPQQPQPGAQGDHSELMAFLPMLRFMAKQPGLSAFFAGVGMNEMSKTLQKMRGKGHHKGDAAQQPQPPAQPSGMPPGGPTPMAGPAGPAQQPNPLAILALLRARQMQQGGAPPSMPPGA